MEQPLSAFDAVQSTDPKRMLRGYVALMVWAAGSSLNTTQREE